MLFRLFLAFILVALLELYLLVKVGTYIGAGAVVAIVIVTAIAGIFLAKWQGLAVFRKMREEVSQGRFPAGSILDGVMILGGGVLLLLPGLLADLLGLLALFPGTRYLVKKVAGIVIMRRLQRGMGKTITIYNGRRH